VDSSNDQLIPIRQLELFKDKRKIENDTKLSASDKKKQLADIEKQLVALDARAKAIKK
jgi:phosphonate transport system substrate-binding protein